MKVLSFNTGYFLGYEGSYLDYLKRPWIGVIGSGEEYTNLDRLVDLVDSEDPDFVLLQEVDGGSMRTSTNGQNNYLQEKIPKKYMCEFHRKYRGLLFPRLPVFRFMGNAVFYTDGKVINHALSTGRKNLVQEIKLNDLSIFSLHLSNVGGWIRKKQLEEIKHIAEKRENYVLSGDLNFHKGKKERQKLEKSLSNPVRSPGKTFPSKNPAKKLDLVTSSDNVKIKNLEQLGDKFSDHRAIKFELEIK